ncbi:DNA repair and recombination protein RadB [Candidatus Woesearchaeota archaeon]|nr:DNA repair and recombination protein RadB [Candidatus Woesearchaeota archaeon]
MEKLGTGTAVLDRLLEGGYESDAVTTIYGPAGTGKTTACLLACINSARQGRKAIFVDTEGGLSVTRLRQLAGNDNSVMERILFLRPASFDEQKKCLEKLGSLATEKVGLVVVDTITSLYRAQRTSDNSELNRELGRQVAALVGLARTKAIPVIVTNQVYSDFEGKKGIRMVGGDIITYSSKCLIELRQLHSSKRLAILQRHRHIPQRELVYEITGAGFEEVQEKGFRLF